MLRLHVSSSAASYPSLCFPSWRTILLRTTTATTTTTRNSNTTANRSTSIRQNHGEYLQGSSVSVTPTDYYGTKVVLEDSSSTLLQFIPQHSPLLLPYVHTSIRHSTLSSTSSSTILVDNNNVGISNINHLSISSNEYDPPKGQQQQTQQQQQKPTHIDMSITFLGTGAGGRPNTYRNASSIVFQYHGSTFLIDVGEGTQRQYSFLSSPTSTPSSSPLTFGAHAHSPNGTTSFLQLEKIFITHLHADHIQGLIGFLLQINVAFKSHWEHRSSTTKQHSHDSGRNHTESDHGSRTVHIYGPPGLYNYIVMNLLLTRSKLHHVSLMVHELISPKEEGEEEDHDEKEEGKTEEDIVGMLSHSSIQHQRQQDDHHAKNRSSIPKQQVLSTSFTSSSSSSSSESTGAHSNQYQNFKDYLSFKDSQWKHLLLNTKLYGTYPNVHYKQVLAEKQEQDVSTHCHPIHEKKKTKRTIRKKKMNHVWMLQQPQEPTPEIAMRQSSTQNVSKKLTIQAIEIQHQWGMPTFGYIFEEMKPLSKIDVLKAISLGVRPSRKYRLLKQGFPVEADDGSRTLIYPHQVLILEDENEAEDRKNTVDNQELNSKKVTSSRTSARQGRKVVILGDNWGVPMKPFVDLCQNVDVLVTEATVGNITESEAIKRGHSTPAMAGKLAKHINAKVLVMNHISNVNSTQDDIANLIRAAKDTNDGVSQIVAAYDFMSLNIPRGGYKFIETNRLF